MPRKHSPPRSQDALARVGAKVRVRLGVNYLPAVVIEDRGFLASGGRRLVRVRTSLGLGAEVVELEVPLDELRAA